jgi:poly(3-hydroxyalkanoate) synthetase
LQVWLNDGVAFPAEAYRTYMKECYQENHLVQGKLIVGGRRVDLAQIACPLLTITAAKDWLCPPESTTILNDLVASQDRRVLELPGGHVGVVAGAGAVGQLWPKLSDWLIAHAEPAPLAEQPPARHHAPVDIAAALQAGAAVAERVEETQALLESTSPLEAVRQPAIFDPGDDTPPPSAGAEV